MGTSSSFGGQGGAGLPLQRVDPGHPPPCPPFPQRHPQGRDGEDREQRDCDPAQQRIGPQQVRQIVQRRHRQKEGEQRHARVDEEPRQPRPWH